MVTQIGSPFDLLRHELKPHVSEVLRERDVENLGRHTDEVVRQPSDPELASDVGLKVLEDDDALREAAVLLVEEYFEGEE